MNVIKKHRFIYFTTTLIIFLSLIFLVCCSSKNAPNTSTNEPSSPIVNDVECWLTKADQSMLLQKQTIPMVFNTNNNNYSTIQIDDSQTFQTIDGFGYTLTGGSAQVIQQLTTSKKQELLQNLFGNNNNDISVSYLRLSIGASDLNDTPFTYDDVLNGVTDVNLVHFNLNKDTIHLIPLLKEILAINPSIKIIATPWSAPVWMKDNNSFIGGSLQSQYYSVYAQYFVKYIQKMKLLGIDINAICPQNEPLNPNNNPSMVMSSTQQNIFIKNYLAPAFQMAALPTKIIIFDHNCDTPNYPLSILNDATTNNFIDGSAFHLYAGDISVLSTIHYSFPNKNIYFTEQYTASNGNFAGDLKWHLKNVVIGSLRNWSKNVLEWNLANDASFSPHTVGGCTTCKGAITIESANNYIKNVSYYIIAHASKFVPQGSVRIASNIMGNIYNVCFKTPTGKFVLIAENDGSTNEIFNIKYNGKWVTTTLEGGAVATYTWN